MFLKVSGDYFNGAEIWQMKSRNNHADVESLPRFRGTYRKQYLTLLLDLAGHSRLSGLGDTAMTHNPQNFTSGPAPVRAG